MDSSTEKTKNLHILKDINAGNIIASLKKEALHTSTVQNNKNFHHNMGTPCSEKEKGLFNLTFPPMITSSVNETSSEDGKTKGYPFFVKVYGNYDDMVQSVFKKIDEILKKASPNPVDLEPEQLTLLFLESLQKLGKSEDFLKKEYAENVTDTGSQFGLDLFKHLCLKILIEDEKDTDPRGRALEKVMGDLKKCYCESLDSPSHAELKKTILVGIGIALKKIKTPTSEFVSDVIKNEKHPDSHPTLAGLINYTKSPQFRIAIMASIPKADTEFRKPPVIVPTTGQVIWTTIYDYEKNPLSINPINTYSQFERLLYRAGDTKRGKKMFELQQSVTTVAPTVYWEKGAGVIQFKATILKIQATHELSGFSKSLSREEAQRDLEEAREAMAYYKREKPQQQDDSGLQEIPEEFINYTNGQDKRIRDKSDQDYQQDIDAMINEAYEFEESSLKKNRY